MLRYLICGFLTITCAWTCVAQDRTSRPNILIVTVDDMSADSIGAFGCRLADTSPNIDAFAKTAVRFRHGHVLVGNCMPGRNIMWSGLYSHVNGVEGFQQVKQPDYPVLCDLAQQAGYFAAIRGKVTHSTPYHPYHWDAVLDSDEAGKKFSTKDIQSYGYSTRRGIALAEKAGKPFCLMVNISDPHKPFYTGPRDRFQPSRVFGADEVPVPGFLPDDDVVRTELAFYYSSVRRADDCFAEIMKALHESGKQEETFVMFLSDHGMPLPFAKTQLYHHSTRTPLLVRWPGVTQPGTEDDHHMVSAVDFVPTLLEVMQHQHPTPDRLHGRSFAPILQGKPQEDRDFVVMQYNENAGRNRHPMRGIQTRQWLYLYNPWSNGQRRFATATTGTATYKQMIKRAAEESEVAERLKLFDHRVVEELYDIERDPDCLVNLIDSPATADKLAELRTQLAERLSQLGDPVAPLLKDHQNVALREKYMAMEDQRTMAAKAARSKPKPKKRKLIELDPELVKHADDQTVVSIAHKLPKRLGEQQLHVTLKDADGKRIQRKIVSIQGNGIAKVAFETPGLSTIRVSAFVGPAYEQHLQHITSGPIGLPDSPEE